MYWLKACPRCGGDLHDIQDVGESYVACLQCARILTDAQEEALPRKTRAKLGQRHARKAATIAA